MGGASRGRSQRRAGEGLECAVNHSHCKLPDRMNRMNRMKKRREQVLSKEQTTRAEKETKTGSSGICVGDFNRV